MCHLSPTVRSLQQAIPNSCPAKALAPSQRLTLGLQAVAGTQSVTGLAEAFRAKKQEILTARRDPLCGCDKTRVGKKNRASVATWTCCCLFQRSTVF